jgi:DNA-binding SARP family transcriptional activator
MAPGASLRLTLIGGFTICAGGRELRIAASGQRLIALLALRDHPVGRAHVAGSLWPDCSAERSLAHLRTTLWRVNQARPRLVVGTGTSLRLDAGIDVDVRNLAAFARGLASPPATRGFQDCLDLESVGLRQLSGELLPDWYDDWVEAEREGLRQLRLHTLEVLAREFSARGRHADAVQAALAALRLEPLRETAHRTLIEVHLAEGNWSEARRQFERCRRLLAEELGVEPSDVTRRLCESPDRQLPPRLIPCYDHPRPYRARDGLGTGVRLWSPAGGRS